MKDDTMQAIQVGLLVAIIVWVVVMMFAVKHIEQKLDALQQATTVQDAPASGGEGES